ncbi:P protein [Almendravirus arboretum]|uniref:P protein n=1 Tax=Almendravirus arboretum TaxID=1972683 RepID=X4QM04_9RHAB|nr:P protein [Almendravirus arboretum]AHU86496.1 P protein [Almendravirus arboretum]
MSNPKVCDDLFNSRRMLAQIDVSAFDISKQISEDYGTTRGTDELNDIEYEENEEKKGLENDKTKTLTGDEIMTPNIFSRMINTPLEKANLELSETKCRNNKPCVEPRQVTFNTGRSTESNDGNKSYEEGYLRAIWDINNLLSKENFKMEITRDPKGSLTIKKTNDSGNVEKCIELAKSDESSCSYKTEIDQDISFTDSESCGVYPPLHYDLMFGGKVEINVKVLVEELKSSNMDKDDLKIVIQLIDNNLENKNAKDILKYIKHSKQYGKIVYQVARKYKI